MIEPKDFYTRQEVEQLLRWQHIATKNKVRNIKIFSHYDFDEKVNVGTVHEEIENVYFDETNIMSSPYKYKFQIKTTEDVQ